MTHHIRIHHEVAEGLSHGKPVVALESTIIAHGMPWPNNLETALRVQDVIRKHGAIPATIAVIEGDICVGLGDDELEFLAKSDNVLKLSRRDLPYAVSAKRTGATTVSATMIVAEKANIRVFVTGGIGGVHKGVAESWDISADLTELGKTDVAVVCAGAKSILDIGKTLQFLETEGVPVLGYQTDHFPAFYLESSGFNVDYRMNTVEELASFVRTKYEVGMEGGIVVGNPIPTEHALDQQIFDAALVQAHEQADKLNIQGKDVTPFLLDAIKKLTEGKSLESNIELVLNNARLGAELAAAL